MLPQGLVAQQQSINKLIELVQQLPALLQAVSEETRETFLADVQAMVLELNGVSVAAAELPSATDAVRAALQAAPEGLRAGELAKLVRGKFATTSKAPDRLVYSILGTLLRQEKVCRDENEIYHLTKK